MTAREAADVIWTLASERTYLALVRDRGWSPARYERWSPSSSPGRCCRRTRREAWKMRSAP